MTILKKIFNKKIDATGLGVFRIFYSLTLLAEVLQIKYFRHLIFDKIPYISYAEIDFNIPITLWIISIIFIIIGLFTRFFTVLNYLLGLILIGSINSYEYHVFYAYMGLNFLLILMPVNKALSLDRLIEQLKYSNTTYRHNPSKKVRQIYYLIPPFIGLAIVYFDSVFYKLASDMWKNGLGAWMPSSLPMITHSNDTFLLNQEWLMKIIGWLTIVFESIFIFTFFRKKWRIPLLTLGLILHLGILFEYPIPWFALTACMIYLLMVPVRFWQKLKIPKAKRQTLTFYYDKDCPLCIRTIITLQFFDIRNKIIFKTVQLDAYNELAFNKLSEDVLLNDIHCVDSKGRVYSGLDTYIQSLRRTVLLSPLSLILRLPPFYQLGKLSYKYVAGNRLTERCTEDNCGYETPNFKNDEDLKILKSITLAELKFSGLKAFIVFATLTQMFLINDSRLIKDLKKSIDIEHDNYSFYNRNFNKYVNFTRTYFGITHHPVFDDKIHFNGYNHVIGVVYKDKEGNEEWLPIIEEDGMPGYYIYSFNWVKWNWRVNSPKINKLNLSRGIRDFTAFWAHKNNIDLDTAIFLIKVKKIDSLNGWEKDYLEKQLAKPWEGAGFIEWKNKKFSDHIKDIESI